MYHTATGRGWAGETFLRQRKKSSSSPRATGAFVSLSFFHSVCLTVGQYWLREGYRVKEYLQEGTVIFLSACIGRIP
jgi:hypothetical protein